MWLIFAMLSDFFAAATAVLAKTGIDGVDSNLATAIRTMVVLLMAWGIVFVTHAEAGIGAISTKSWLFLILSGLAQEPLGFATFMPLRWAMSRRLFPLTSVALSLQSYLPPWSLVKHSPGKLLSVR